MTDNLYQLLGVSNIATKEEIKRAYRKLATQHHSDKGGDAERFNEIKDAHDILMDDKRRAQYDTYGRCDKPRDINQLARQTIATTFGSLLQQYAADPGIDYIGQLTKSFRQAHRKSKSDRASVVKHISRCQKLIENTEGVILIGVIQQRLNTCRAQLAQLEEQVATTEKCQEIVKGCRCGEDVERVCGEADAPFRKLCQ